MREQRETRRWRLTIAYDGQPFEGWQSQPSGNTIQDHLEKALARIAKQEGITTKKTDIFVCQKEAELLSHKSSCSSQAFGLSGLRIIFFVFSS